MPCLIFFCEPSGRSEECCGMIFFSEDTVFPWDFGVSSSVPGGTWSLSGTFYLKIKLKLLHKTDVLRLEFKKFMSF